jgi:hypothetical protein
MMTRDRLSIARKLLLAGASAGFLFSAMMLLLQPPNRAPEPKAPENGSHSDLDVASVPGASQDWWTTVQADLERREYEASTTREGLLQAPNRAQDLRTTFHPHGIEVVPRTSREVAPAWRFAWETAGIGRSGRMQAADPVSPTAEGTRVIYRHDGWGEWYENTAEGVEQGFTVEREPAGDGPLWIAGGYRAALHAELRPDGAVDFMDAHGACVLRYGELHVWDARGTELKSELAVAGTELAIVIDDRDASYPLLVDPLLSSPAWTADSNQSGAHFGISVSTAGDVNGDGFSDVIVGAPDFDNPDIGEGRVYVYHGSASGLSAAPNWTAESNQGSAVFGFSAGTAGDVNGDGFSDVIVGALRFDNDQADEGRAFVYHGSASGLSATPNWTAESNQSLSLFGYSVATAGDVNGDGFADVVVGAWAYDNEHTDEGRAYVYHGSASGLSPTANWMGEGNQASASFGISVATAGDVNGDRFSDLIIGASGLTNGQANEGAALIYHGSAGGLGIVANWIGDSDQPGSSFGLSVSTAGDVNGDGYADVIIGAPAYDNEETDEGQAFVYLGGPNGLAMDPAWNGFANQAGSNFGGSVGTAGDVNGDGCSDVIIGASGYDNGQTNEGWIFVYQGSVFGLQTSGAWIAQSNQGGAQLGTAVATAGDVNGDGYSDVIVGAHTYNNPENDEGGAFVYYGSGDKLEDTARWFVGGGQEAAFFGASVSTAGDVNGDGYSDVIVGAGLYDNDLVDEGRAYVFHGSDEGLSTIPSWTAEGNQADAAFGFAVSTAGDVNGDGFSDVIVGSPSFDCGQTNEGRAFVYQGSTAGLSITPAWIAESDEPLARVGFSVSTAGDVNGDGYDDVVVGAPGNDQGLPEGRAFGYHGSASGLASTPAWTAEDPLDPGAEFGFSVAAAGDVNGDGYGDVIIGAPEGGLIPGYEGCAYTYHGSPAGLSATHAWLFEGDLDFAETGHAVETAGDVNGDNYSDVIVGIVDYGDEGRAVVFHGSASGLSAMPNWTADGGQSNGQFSISVGTAGDVNGDGYSDVIVGDDLYDNLQHNAGRAVVYHGSAIGLSFTPSFIFDSAQANSQFGFSAGTAGDINGDGFSDVVVGAIRYSVDHLNEGRGFAFFGNKGDGPHRIPQQARTDDSAPISPLGRSDSESSFLLKALGRTAAGRGHVRLQFEVKPAGVPFDGSGIVTGSFLDTGTPAQGLGSAVPLSGLANGLTPETLYHWRLRFDSKSPHFPRSPWLTLAGNNVTEADLRTAAAQSGVAGQEAPGAQLLLLEPVRPNPLAAHGEIAYTLPGAGDVRLTVVDVAGRVRTVIDGGTQTAGRHQMRWDARDSEGRKLPAGVYLLRLETAGREMTRKLVIAR